MSIDNLPLRTFISMRSPRVPDVPADNPYKHLLGVELELENAVVNRLPVGWTPHEDQSLRDGIEFVLTQPLNGEPLVAAVDSYYAAEIAHTAGPRTSTHIHVDFTQGTVGQARSAFAIMYALEAALFAVIEEKRKWCGYCMPLSEMAPSRIRNIMCSTDHNTFSLALGGRNQEKYYGLNLNSLRKHGTIELRYFTGGPRRPELMSWLMLCNELRNASMASTVEDFLAIETEDQLRDWCANMPTWGQRLVDAVGAESVLHSIHDLASTMAEDAGAQRRDTLVFLTPSLLKYYSKRIFTNDAARDAFTTATKNVYVLTVGEFASVVQRASRASLEARYIVPEPDYPDAPYDSDDDDDDDVTVRPTITGTWIDDVPTSASTDSTYQDLLRRAQELTAASAPSSVPGRLFSGRNTGRTASTTAVNMDSIYRTYTTPNPFAPVEQPSIFDESSDDTF